MWNPYFREAKFSIGFLKQKNIHEVFKSSFSTLSTQILINLWIQPNTCTKYILHHIYCSCERLVVLWTFTFYKCVFLSYHIRVAEWIYTLQLPKCQGTPCLKQTRYLKFRSVSNGIQTQHHLSCIRTLNHLPTLTSLAKWLSFFTN